MENIQQPIMVENLQKGPGYFELPLIERWIKVQTWTGALDSQVLSMCERLRFIENPNQFLDRVVFKFSTSQITEGMEGGIFEVLFDDTCYFVGWIEYSTLCPNSSNNLRLNLEYKLHHKNLLSPNDIRPFMQLARHRGVLSKYEKYYSENPPNFVLTKIGFSTTHKTAIYSIKTLDGGKTIKGLNPDSTYSFTNGIQKEEI